MLFIDNPSENGMVEAFFMTSKANNFEDSDLLGDNKMLHAETLAQREQIAELIRSVSGLRDLMKSLESKRYILRTDNYLSCTLQQVQRPPCAPGDIKSCIIQNQI